tara:strand:- start:506 stop:775 length:270 start_codon:yes stop_codon:yes gene_type:complete
MAKIENIDGPIGWLIDPRNKWAIHFDFKKESNENIGTVFTIDMWGVAQNGNPMQFKSRRKASKQDSLKTWKQLISSNWVKVDFDKALTA